MHLMIVSGRSGSGKTVALTTLEDLGFYCVDNLPVDLLITLAEKLHPTHDNIAVSIDARNLPKDVATLNNVLSQLKLAYPEQCDILYLDAEENILLKRFSETRRKHPLTSPSCSLQEAILYEKRLLSPLSHRADISLDTSELSKHELSRIVRDKVAKKNEALQVLLLSFGFKHGSPSEADFIFDVRCLPNPYWEEALRNHSGQEPPVIDYLASQPDVSAMIQDIKLFLDNWVPRFMKDNRSYLTVGIGCTGGKHRSVYIVDTLQKALAKHFSVQARHRDLSRTQVG
jgi:UPF0042 nucleotide-binding protein